MFKHYIAGTVVLATAIAAGAAFAETEDVMEPSLTEMLNAPVSFGQAAEIAEKNGAGEIIEITRDELAGQQIYLASLATETTLTDLAISAQDGAVLATSVQTAASPAILEELIAQEIEDVMEFVGMMDGFMGLPMLETLDDAEACQGHQDG